jgi:hypothetical protein
LHHLVGKTLSWGVLLGNQKHYHYHYHMAISIRGLFSGPSSDFHFFFSHPSLSYFTLFSLLAAKNLPTTLFNGKVDILAKLGVSHRLNAKRKGNSAFVMAYAVAIL